MKVSCLLLLILGFVTNGLAETFANISSEIIDDSTSELRQKIVQLCERNSSPAAIKIFRKAENQLKAKVQLNLQNALSKMIRSNSVLKKDFNGLCDIDFDVNNYLIAAKPCLMEKKIHYQAEEFSNSILERRIFPAPKHKHIVDSACDKMKSSLREAVDSWCFKHTLNKLRGCFINNTYFKDYAWILSDSNLTEVTPRNFPYYVIKNAQPSFLTDLEEIIVFRKCLIDTLSTCKYSSLGSNIEAMFFPELDEIKALLD